MGNQNCVDFLKRLVSRSIHNIKLDSLICEDVNNEAFNIYFDNGKRLYCLQVEQSSGINVHLKHHQGYRKNGEKAFATDPIMNHSTIKALKRIKRKTIFNHDARMEKIVIYLCDQINRQQAT